MAAKVQAISGRSSRAERRAAASSRVSPCKDDGLGLEALHQEEEAVGPGLAEFRGAIADMGKLEAQHLEGHGQFLRGTARVDGQSQPRGLQFAQCDQCRFQFSRLGVVGLHRPLAEGLQSLDAVFQIGESHTRRRPEAFDLASLVQRQPASRQTEIVIEAPPPA